MDYDYTDSLYPQFIKFEFENGELLWLKLYEHVKVG